jgi:hypothetical protein
MIPGVLNGLAQGIDNGPKMARADYGGFDQADQYRQQARQIETQASQIKPPEEESVNLTPENVLLATLGTIAAGKYGGQFLSGLIQGSQARVARKNQIKRDNYAQQFQAMLQQSKSLYGLADDAEQRAYRNIQRTDALNKEAGAQYQRTLDRIQRGETARMLEGGRNVRNDANIKSRAELLAQKYALMTDQDMLRLAANGPTPEQRQEATEWLATKGIKFTPPNTTGAQKKIEQGAQRITDARAKNAPAIEYAKLRNEWYPRQVQSQIDAREAQAARARELTARGGNTPSGVTGRLDNQTKTALKYQIGTWEMEMAAAKKVLEDIKSGKVNPLTDGNGLAVASAALQRIDKLNQNLMIAKQKLQGKRPLAGNGREVLPDPAGPPKPINVNPSRPGLTITDIKVSG